MMDLHSTCMQKLTVNLAVWKESELIILSRFAIPVLSSWCYLIAKEGVWMFQGAAAVSDMNMFKFHRCL